ncbi:hypothetical protein DVH24_006790 [Malus domestica]|uniref:RNase H type-1 domain-containing protein n=1 Tax=Malus domestica TaxID=3750 RepID=A0A498J7R6_MALDO|nr:hypothetical protein DVH24_006790 [Malus domestica]
MDLPFVECGHVQREANSVAHRLARMGLNYLQEVLWFEVPPDLIQDLLFEEGMTLFSLDRIESPDKVFIETHLAHYSQLVRILICFNEYRTCFKKKN